MALTLKITNAGLALLAQSNTIGPIVLQEIAIGSGTWATAPTGSETSLKILIKKLQLKGDSTINGYMHLTAKDETVDSYSIFEVGLYTSTNVLFAVGGSTTAFLIKSTVASSLIALDLFVGDQTAGTITVGNTNYLFTQATETISGVAEIATQAEVITGSDDLRIVTPLKLAVQNYLPKSGGTVTGEINSSVTATASTNLVNKGYVDGTVSKTTQGYCIMPNGLIMQWGSQMSYPTGTAGATGVVVTFPIPFPNACLNVVASDGNVGCHSVGSLITGNTSFTVFGKDLNNVFRDTNIRWQAIGY